MKTTKKAPRKTAPRKKGTPGENGNLTAQEKTTMLLQARDAYHYQIALKNITEAVRFDDWRRDKVQDLAGRDGISKLDRSQWREMMGHFCSLAGDEDRAFGFFTTTGVKSYRPTDSGDTFETCETYVALILENLKNHSLNPVADPKGHIHAGWFLAAARQRTGKPTLTMDTLADRLDPRTLHGLLSHLRNHISKREGRDNPDARKPRAKRVQSNVDAQTGNEPF